LAIRFKLGLTFAITSGAFAIVHRSNTKTPMPRRLKLNLKRSITLTSLLFLATPAAVYSWLAWRRPPRTDMKQVLFPGVIYQRKAYSAPRSMVFHQVQVDLNPGIDVLVTPGQATSNGMETIARTTSEFAQEFQVQLAINASFFYPFREKTPWNYYPYPGDPVSVLGQGISNGKSYSPAQSDWPTVCFLATHQAQIAVNGQCPPKTLQAVAGNQLLVVDRKPAPLPDPSDDQPYPRTAIALNRSGNRLWILIVDGKQPLYSDGMTLRELQAIALQLGAETCLNLDGGGSTTLVTKPAQTPIVLNAPIHTRIPMRERPVANHIGFKIKHVPEQN
jgi:Phosphodiester glycosidase